MNDRFRFRTPVYGTDEKFKKFIFWLAEDGFPGITERAGSAFKEAEQCTGLKDKNGKLIYEGDILKIVLHSTQHKPFAFQEKAVVEFKEGAFGHKDFVGHASLNHYAPGVTFEIIGNIHENPELLEDKK